MMSHEGEELREEMTKQMGGKREERMFYHVRRWQTDEWPQRRSEDGRLMTDRIKLT